MFDLGRHGLPKSDPTLLRLRLIGRMEARSMTGESVLPIGGKTRGLLAILALSHRKPVARSRLSELLWSRRPDDMARASLRQEIHRLLDALSPLGVDIIDAQRHALSLKPALTSVDVERIQTIGLPAFEALGSPTDMLLGELNGIDPAFDVWLDEQRVMLSRHIQFLLESALAEQPDPVALLDVANRLIQVDEINESAWRARIHASVQRGEYAQAALSADQVIRLFEARVGQTPGPATMALIASIRPPAAGSVRRVTSEAASDDAVYAAGVVAADVDSSGVMVDLPDEAAIEQPYVPGDLRVKQQNGNRRIASIVVAPIATVRPDLVADLANDISDRLSIDIVSLQIFNVMTPPSSSLDERQFFDACDRMGVDFVVTGIVRSVARSEGRIQHKLLLRLVDLRHGNGLVWAVGLNLPFGVETEFGAVRSLLGSVCSSLQWAVFLFEARRTSHRPAKDLTATGLAARSIMMLLRCDRQSLREIESLLAYAEQLDAEQPLVLLARAMATTATVTEFLGDEEEMRNALALAKNYSARFPENPIGRFLVVYLNCKMPGRLPMAEAILATLSPGLSAIVSEDFAPGALLRALVALLRGESAVALREIDLYRAVRTMHPGSVLIDPVMMMILFLSDRVEDAIVMGRMLSELYPRRVATLIYYLAALSASTSEGLEAEILQAREHLFALIPDVTIARIMCAHTYLPEAALARLEFALGKAGLAAG